MEERQRKVLKSGRRIQLAPLEYEHGFEEYVLHWENAQRDAAERCMAWGYTSATFADSGTIQCIKSLEYGCLSGRVTYTVQCTE